MAEEQVVTLEAPVTTPQADPFGASWTEAPTEVKLENPATPTPTPVTEPPVVTPTVTTTTNDKEEVLDIKDWLKREFEIDDVAVLKAERDELKKFKEAPPTPAEIKFADDQSKIIHELLREGKKKEVRQFLETQERLETYTTAEVNDDTAPDIIKLGMQLKYKDLSPKEIEYKFNKEFGLPKEPTMLDGELEDEFNQRKSEWQDKVNDIRMNRNIEAKLTKPELDKLKSQIVLPELSKPVPQIEQPTQESLEAAKRDREAFLNKLESDYVKFDGYTTTVKDESVELPISFKTSDEAKVAIKERFKAGFDINGFLDGRWSDANGQQKVEQIISDIFILENLDKVLSGVANKAAADRLAEHIKAGKNISLTNSKTSQQTFDPTQSGQQKVSPFSQGAWSEKPPALINN